ncbi:MAG: hypothetical protein JSW56_06375, partial [Deltaproteobacteria bacterium]
FLRKGLDTFQTLFAMLNDLRHFTSFTFFCQQLFIPNLFGLYQSARELREQAFPLDKKKKPVIIRPVFCS